MHDNDFNELSQDEIIIIFTRFKAQNARPETELIAPNEFTLLVSVVLSAQSTDKSVNKATFELYQKFSSPEDFLQLGEAGLIEYIKTIGLYRSKARHVMGLCRMLVDEYHSRLPRTREDLQRLPGVGRKTASVVLNVVYGEPTMPVDTHLLRIAPRMGLSSGTKPIEVENDLLKKIPREFLDHAHHWLILHGRYVCVARKPKCIGCIINDICKKNGVKNKNA